MTQPNIYKFYLIHSDVLSWPNARKAPKYLSGIARKSHHEGGLVWFLGNGGSRFSDAKEYRNFRL